MLSDFNLLTLHTVNVLFLQIHMLNSLLNDINHFTRRTTGSNIQGVSRLVDITVEG